jgi:hypothetical protein
MEKRKCSKRGCLNHKAKHRQVCGKHHMEQVRKNNPMRCCYTNLKANAKRRNKNFTITFEYFTEFCEATDYIAGKGRTRDSYSIDCIDPRLGYIPGNIRRTTVAENSKKKNHLNYDWQTKTAIVVKSAPVDNSQNIF